MKLILGSMTFGEQVDRETARTMIDSYLDSGNNEIDTAHIYCDGKTESMLGQLLPALRREGIYLATKVNPWNDGGLAPEQVNRQFDESLQRLGCDSVDLLYLHSPDLETPVEKTLQACFEIYQRGGFREFGLSNYAAWQVAEVVETCRRHGWMRPVVYQGMYNALTRDVERELFPCLRNYGMRFYAYNPLAGGLLSGKHLSLDAIPDSGRFVVERGYQERYWKQDYFETLNELRQVCDEAGLTQVQVAMRWLANHSLIQAELGDGIILGASKIEQLRENLGAFDPAPLDTSIIEILDRGWEIIKPNCFRYFRP